MSSIPRASQKGAGRCGFGEPHASATPPPVCDHPADLLWSGICRAALAYRSSLRREVGHLKPAKSVVFSPEENGPLLEKESFLASLTSAAHSAYFIDVLWWLILMLEIRNVSVGTRVLQKKCVCENASGGELVDHVRGDRGNAHQSKGSRRNIRRPVK